MDSQQTQILKVVAGMFNAAPGKELLGVMNDYATANGVQSLAVALAATPLFNSAIVGGDDAADVAALMKNFGFVADSDPASAGSQAQKYIADNVAAKVDFGVIAYNIVTFLSSGSAPAIFNEAATLLSNKAAVSAAFSATLPSSDLSTLQSVLASVDGSHALTDAEIAAIVAPYSAPDTFVLTNGTDVATAHHFVAGLVYTPGGDNRINALQDEDILTGVGNDTSLTATLGNANDNGGSVITPELNNIGTVNAAFTGSSLAANGAVTALDMQDASGLNAVNITRVSQSVNSAEIGNIQDATVNKLSLSDTNANQAGVVEFSYGAGVLAGDNAVNLGLDNVQVGALNIGQNTSGINGLGVGLEGYENVTLTSTGGANSVGTLNLPMDTGTAGSLVIEGSGNLTIGAKGDVVNAQNNALTEVKDLYTAGSGIAQAGGRIATINASGFNGNLTLVLDNILDVGKADTSGADQNVTVTGGKGNDTFVLYDAVQAGDSIDGGDGNDTLLFYSGSSLDSSAKSIENANVLADGSIAGGNASIDFNNLPDVTSTTVRNISSDVDVPGFGGDGVLENSADPAVNVKLTNMSAAQATGITVQHSTTGNNQIQNTTLTAAVKANTSSDTLGVTIVDGNNVDPRFNFSIVTAIPGNDSTIENVTITDSDTESNSIELTNFATHTGTITLTGGSAGNFINLDVDTAGGDRTAFMDGGTNIAGATPDYGQVQQGLMGINTDGTAVPAGFTPNSQDVTAGSFFDVSGTASQVRLGAATIDASGEKSDVILRVGTNAASATGAQTITTGSGNDHVIFDNLNDSRAGLSISDKVDGGDGNDTLVIDGNGVRISLGASEWTNVKNFENLQLVGTSAAPLSTLLGQNAYNLTLTNDLIQANGTGMLHIINDNDANNDKSGTSTGTNYLDTPFTGVESGVTLDARTLNASNHFTYNGEEGASRTADRFIFTDANINGGNVIDGGAVDNLSDTNSPANADIMEVRNTATVTVGDLAGISNVGTIAAVNDQATAQTLDLQLNDDVIDAMVDSYHAAAAGAGNFETLNVQLNNPTDIAAPVANMGLSLDASALTTKTAVNVKLDQSGGGGAADSIQLSPSGGVVTLDTFHTAANGAGYTGPNDTIVLSLSKFALSASLAGGPLNAGDFTSSAALVNPATDVSANEIVFDQTNGNVYYNTDGATAGGLIQIATLAGVTDLAVGDFSIIA